MSHFLRARLVQSDLSVTALRHHEEEVKGELASVTFPAVVRSENVSAVMTVKMF